MLTLTFQIATPENAMIAERMIERFGFPIFVAICSLFLFAAVWRYFSKELSMTRKEFLGYLQQRDEHNDAMMARLNDAYNRNTVAFVELKHAVERRVGIEQRQTDVLETLTKTIDGPFVDSIHSSKDT